MLDCRLIAASFSHWIFGLINFEWIIGLLLAAVVLSALARRLCVPYPTFLAVGGPLLALVPNSPSWVLDPKLALALFVAPPDAAAAITILRQVNLPYRLMKILEGESLLNDATAPLIYRTAPGTEAARHLSWSQFGSSIALVLIGSVVAGYLFSKLWMKIAPLFDDAPSATILQTRSGR